MQLAIGIVAALLAGWFFGCIITYKVGNRILVEGMGIKSAEFIMLVLYGAGVAAYFCCRPVGRWILLGVLLFWAVVQFFCHWYYFIFGASEKKLQSSVSYTHLSGTDKTPWADQLLCRSHSDSKFQGYII